MYCNVQYTTSKTAKNFNVDISTVKTKIMGKVSICSTICIYMKVTEQAKCSKHLGYNINITHEHEKYFSERILN